MAALKGRVAVVTGGASGIGRGIALALAARGVDVAIADLNVERGEATAAALRIAGVRSHFSKCDVTSDTDVETLCETVQAEFGSTDILVNNAGVIAAGAFEEIPLAAWQRCFDVNILAVVRCTRVFLPALKAAGARGFAHIVNTASLSGLFANEPFLTPYGASKAALLNLSENLAVALEPAAIGVTCLCPGAVQTNFAEHVSVYGEGGPLGAFGTGYVPICSPEEVGVMVVDAIDHNRFLLTSGHREREVLHLRAVDPEGFIKAMAAFQHDGADFPFAPQNPAEPK
jgi:NAD(P)-dependent dehydrogenase (short-subunit alcohol dehydrogenase family)